MNILELEARLNDWFREADGLGIPRDKLPSFLARRIVDSGLTTAQEDLNITTAMLGGAVRKVRVKGRRGGHIDYEIAEGQGRIGMGILPISAFTDNTILATIIDRMEGGR